RSDSLLIKGSRVRRRRCRVAEDHMRVVLADLKSTDGFVSKDTVAGGYGSRLRPLSRVARVFAGVKQRLHAPPSVQMAYLAALADERGHDVRFTRGEPIE